MCVPPPGPCFSPVSWSLVPCPWPSSRWSTLLCVTLALVLASENGTIVVYNVLHPPVLTALLPYLTGWEGLDWRLEQTIN
jgi:hypothetical protein